MTKIQENVIKEQNRRIKLVVLIFATGLPWGILAIWFDFRPVNLVYACGLFTGFYIGRRLCLDNYQTDKKGND